MKPGFSRLQQSGFTLIELVMSLVIIGILAVVAMPKFNLLLSPSVDAVQQTVLSALRQARSHSFAHRRAVCVVVSSSSLTMTQASSYPASSCVGTPILAPDGEINFIKSFQGVIIDGSPSQTIHFQPDGKITTDAAGLSVSNFSIAVSFRDQNADVINIVGATANIN